MLIYDLEEWEGEVPMESSPLPSPLPHLGSLCLPQPCLPSGKKWSAEENTIFRSAALIFNWRIGSQQSEVCRTCHWEGGWVLIPHQWHGYWKGESLRIILSALSLLPPPSASPMRKKKAREVGNSVSSLLCHNVYREGFIAKLQNGKDFQ